VVQIATGVCRDQVQRAFCIGVRSGGLHVGGASGGSVAEARNVQEACGAAAVASMTTVPWHHARPDKIRHVPK
jgi:hypothetical protein